MSGNASHIANINPFRYRGYYYDTETGFYYLQSRYYDPVVGRFLNADTFVSTGQGILGNNMFAYCGNNPIMMGDHSGYCPANSIGPCPGEDRCAYYELRNTNFDYYFPEGGVIKGRSVTRAHVTVHYPNVTYIPPDAVKDYYLHKYNGGSLLCKSIVELLLSIITTAKGMPILSNVMIVDSIVSVIYELKDSSDSNIILSAIENHNGLVVYKSPTMSGDSRIVNVNTTFYMEWTGKFGQYPYACYPF